MRRVPKEYRSIDRRGHVLITTGIRVPHDPRGTLARRRVAELDDQLQTYWRQAKSTGEPEKAKIALEASKQSCELGLPLLSVNESLATDLEIILARLKRATADIAFERAAQSPTPDVLGKAALVFGIPSSATPSLASHVNLRVSQMIDEYARINATLLARKSPAQLKKWQIHRTTAVATFIQSIGCDPLITELVTQHTHRFRSYWQNRVLNGEVLIASANRKMRSVAGLYTPIHRFHQLEQKNPFSSLTIPGGREGKRLAYDPAFVQSHFLAEGMFDGLNNEARRIIYLIVETGLRLSEACALTSKTIHLDASIPYVEIIDEDRELKTPGSARCIPLVGVALLAMQKQPDGFPRYRDKADTLSGLVNQVLTEKKLRPGGKKQTLYSLRHTLVDRLIAVEAPNKIQEDLLGHVHMYGEGSTLEHRRRWLEKIAFKPPSSI
jgi:site-specific recombinase XerD